MMPFEATLIECKELVNKILYSNFSDETIANLENLRDLLSQLLEDYENGAD